MANLRKFFRKIMAGAFSAERRAAMHPPRKNLALPQEKFAAFSLPQDSRVELMFGAARFSEQALSVSRNIEFRSHRDDIVRCNAGAQRASASIDGRFPTGSHVSPGHVA
jgi:hypothetical protein